MKRKTRLKWPLAIVICALGLVYELFSNPCWWPIFDRFGEPSYAFLHGTHPVTVAEVSYPLYADYVYSFRNERHDLSGEIHAAGFAADKGSGRSFMRRLEDGEHVEIYVTRGKYNGKSFHIDADDVSTDKDTAWTTIEIIKPRPSAYFLLRYTRLR